MRRLTDEAIRDIANGNLALALDLRDDYPTLADAIESGRLNAVDTVLLDERDPDSYDAINDLYEAVAAPHLARKRSVTTQRLAKLAQLLRRYGHRWDASPSQRMVGWIDEYQELRRNAQASGTWAEYCARHNLAADHDAYDCLC